MSSLNSANNSLSNINDFLTVWADTNIYGYKYVGDISNLDKRNADRAFMWTEWEADDIVVFKKREHPDDYILCAVDKDVLYTLPGRHFNYYSSMLHNIDMKFIEVDNYRAVRHHFIQTLMGDKGDNVIGLKGIGPAKAEKILMNYEDTKVLWTKVVEAYEAAGRSEIDAIKNMRLVSMHQLVYNEDGNIEVKLWKI